MGEKLLIGFAAGKYVDAICTAEDHSRFFAVVFVVYWLHLAVHAVDQDMARLLTPERYGGAPNPWTPKLTLKEALLYTMHGENENDGNPEQHNTMNEEKMKHATDILMKKRLPHGSGPSPEQRLDADARRRSKVHSRTEDSTNNVQDEMDGGLQGQRRRNK